MRDYLKIFAGIVVATLVSACLAGCGGGGGGGSSGMSGLLSGASGIFGSSPKLTVAPIIGAPENIGGELTKALIVAGKDRNLTITPGTNGEEYILRGYLIASPERRASKISYIWDVTDTKGTRVIRVTGEEMVAKGSRSKPWSGMDSAAIRSIAAKSTSQLAAKLPGGRSGSSAPVAAAPAVATTAVASTAAATARPVKAGPAKVLVVPVSGAPGDGSRSLPTALKKRLYKGGIKLANGTSGGVYTVKGTVKLTSASGGKESIRISWQVFDPNGKALGTVTQQNNIPKGSLNGPWGAIADASAGAAADGIIKLLPKSS